MKKIVIIVGGIVLVMLIAAGFFLISMNNYGPKFSDVKELLEPKILEKPAKKVLEVYTVGEPNATVGPAFGLLFKTYFRLKGVPKGPAMEAPRARWPQPLSSPRNQWIGIYAIPVPASITILPDVPAKNGLRIELKEWQYGCVAEILHVGAYSTENPTVEKLKKYIAENKYEICGDHEEEYLKGPGYLFNNPEKYLTIIRYQVRKRGGQ